MERDKVMEKWVHNLEINLKVTLMKTKLMEKEKLFSKMVMYMKVYTKMG
jgi:hypothetical protein